jgi:hypothetical protein
MCTISGIILGQLLQWVGHSEGRHKCTYSTRVPEFRQMASRDLKSTVDVVQRSCCKQQSYNNASNYNCGWIGVAQLPTSRNTRLKYRYKYNETFMKTYRGFFGLFRSTSGASFSFRRLVLCLHTKGDSPVADLPPKVSMNWNRTTPTDFLHVNRLQLVHIENEQ